MAHDCLAGIFLGGRARRMAGEAKGLLPTPGGGAPILEHLRALCEARQMECVAVGPTDAYREALRGWTSLFDAPPGIGPLGGLGALLQYAGARPCVALACDMPHVTPALLGRLATERCDAGVLAPRDPESGRWQPLFARYTASRVQEPLQQALAAGERSFQALFARLEVQEMPLSAAERACLRDWDRPEDVEP